MPYTGIDPYRKKISFDDSPDISLHTVGIHVEAKSPSPEKIPFFLYSWATSYPG